MFFEIRKGAGVAGGGPVGVGVCATTRVASMNRAAKVEESILVCLEQRR